MSKVVWSADKGWHDDGEEVVVELDEKGRLTTRPNEEGGSNVLYSNHAAGTFDAM